MMMPDLRSRMTITVSLLLVFCMLALRSNADSLVVSDYLDLEDVSDPQISPDGSRVLYTREWVDRQNDERASAVWIIDADGAGNRFLTEGSNARWSPDGERILFIANDDNEKPQIFVHWLDSASTRTQVTRVDYAPRAPEWSPDATRIAFVAIVPADEPWEIDMPEAPEGAKWTEPPRIVHRLHYRQDRVGYTDPGFSHLFVVPADAGTPRQITHGEWHVGAQFDGLFFGAGYDWTPDGKTIVFDGLKDIESDFRYQRSQIYAVDTTTEELQQLTEQDGYWAEPTVSPDGGQIAFIGYPASEATYTMPRLHLMASDGSNSRLLTADFDRSPETPIWSENGRGIYFTAEDQGYSNVFYVSLDGDTRNVTSGKQVTSLVSAGDSGRVGAGIRQTYTEPGDVYVFSLDGRGQPRRLTSANNDLLFGKTLGTQEEIRYPSKDGTRVHGWLLKPPGFDPTREYPLILEIHGGPFSQYYGRFDFRYQVFASNGFVVLYTNPRGSTGYGEAFSRAIDHAYPSVDYDDLMAGVDAVIDMGFVDTDRLYVGGCSGGGVLSSWVIGHTNRFAAAAVRCPVTNWISMAGQTDIPYFTHSFFEKPYWEDPTRWLQQSSVMYVDEVTTPTLVMTGVEDLRTPMPQSEEYYAALKMLGVPSKLLRFNEEYHGTGAKPSNYMRTILYMMSWYNEHTLAERAEDGEGSRKTQ
jgi:dipeptidyl aminopeptidase/acylaminoacyl peptidase